MCLRPAKICESTRARTSCYGHAESGLLNDLDDKWTLRTDHFDPFDCQFSSTHSQEIKKSIGERVVLYYGYSFYILSYIVTASTLSYI